MKRRQRKVKDTAESHRYDVVNSQLVPQPERSHEDSQRRRSLGQHHRVSNACGQKPMRE